MDVPTCLARSPVRHGRRRHLRCHGYRRRHSLVVLRDGPGPAPPREVTANLVSPNPRSRSAAMGNDPTCEDGVLFLAAPRPIRLLERLT